MRGMSLGCSFHKNDRADRVEPIELRVDERQRRRTNWKSHHLLSPNHCMVVTNGGEEPQVNLNYTKIQRGLLHTYRKLYPGK